MNKTEHLLTCLIEECAEIQKAATKALRFGLDDHALDQIITNGESIAEEFIDLTAVIELLENEDIIPSRRSTQSTQTKKNKIEKYMRYAESRCTLIKD